MFSKVRFVISIILMVSLISLLAACGGESTSSNGDKKVTLELAHYENGPLADAIKKYAKKYSQEHPNVKIKLTYIPYNEFTKQLTVQATSGDLPDIIMYGVNETQIYAKTGILENINPQVKKWGEIDQYYKGLQKIHKLNGDFYGLPIQANAMVLFYNKDLVPKPPKTWGDLRKISKKVTNNKTYAMAASAANSQLGTASFIPFLWSSGADVGSLTSPPAIKALTLWKDMVDQGYMSKEITNWDFQDVTNAFTSKRAAMMIDGPWEIPTIKEKAPDLNWGIAPIPKDKKSVTVAGGESLGIGKGQNVEEAWKFIKWLSDPKRILGFLKTSGNLPARKDLSKNDYFQKDPQRKELVKIIETTQGYGWGTHHNEFNLAIANALQKAVSGVSSAKQALKEASQKVKAALKDD